MVTTSERLRMARERRGLTMGQVAQSLGLSPQHYEDVEVYDQELETNVSIGQLLALLKELRLNPRDLFPEAEAARPVPFVALKTAIEDHLRQRTLTRVEFEEAVGWSLEGPLADPTRFRELNLDALKDITAPLGIGWLGVVVAESQDQGKS
jgi:transcriptional regulator with XRE-family HTH domain